MYNLNINKSSIVPTNLIVGRVLDKPFDTIQFKIHDGLDVMDLTGCTLEFRGTTPDNKKVTSNVIEILDAKSGEIEFTFPPNFYSAKGHFQNAYFVIKKGTNSDSTNDLLITVLNAVDFNLDDAPIIIDQLDDLIQAVIDDLNNQLSKVKGDIKQTQDNITTLKKDVDAYKGQFNTEISKMQKQLDDLAKAINQTDIQRPQITQPNGNHFIINDKNKSILDHAKQLGAGIKTVYIINAMGIPEQFIHGLLNTSASFSLITFEGTSGVNGNSYSYSFSEGVDKGWKRLDGQVAKLTRDDGGSYITLSDKSKTTQEMLDKVDSGYKFITFGEASDLPSSWIYGFISTNGNASFKSFLGTSVDGTVYNYNTITKVWKKLDRLEYGIATQTQNGLMLSTDKVKLDGLEKYSDATQSKSGLMSSTDKVKLDGLEKHSDATQLKSGLMSSTDKVKLDGLEKYSDATQYESGLMSSTDKVKLDKLTIPLSKGELLWSGKSYPNGASTLNPSKKLSECENGWIITMQDFSNYTLNNWDFSYHYIEKTSALKNSGYNTKLLSFSTNGASMIYKQVYITDDSLKGHNDNENAGNNKLQVISAIHSW